MQVTQADVTDAVALAFREQWSQIVATVMRITGDRDLAEECAQDAFAKALERWPTDGVPNRPGAWLTTTARNRAIDRRRREARGRDKLAEVARESLLHEAPAMPDDHEPELIPDDRLRLIFTCCHPVLPMETRVALALRTLAGLSTSTIARAFLVTEMTMSKRLVRAKDKIRRAKIPFRAPPPHLLAERTEAVLGVLYLMYTEGRRASGGVSMPRDLCVESIRLARMLVALIPDDAEARGLLALLLLLDAGREGRVDGLGRVTTLEKHDLARCDDEGRALLAEAQRLGRPGTYQLRAELLACKEAASTAA